MRRKTSALDALNADVIVVQECEDPAVAGGAYRDWAGRYVWRGETKNKGIGVFARNGLTLEALDWDDRGFAQFLPVRIDDRFDLLAVWTQAVVPSTFSYIGQFWHYLQLHRAALGPETLMCGDLNSNAIWDKKRRASGHWTCIDALEESGFTSLYHLASGEAQGAESRPTFYLQRNPAKPYHLDYVFAHQGRLCPGWSALRVGELAEWIGLSDHMPVIVEL